MRNALSFDVEEYFHVHAFGGVIRRQEWDSIPSRVVGSTRLILRLLREHDTRATFFVLGWVANQHPELVREIADEGHELASHGYAHEPVCNLDSESFRRDVQRSLEAIVTACPGACIRGYRAPSFSINRTTPWAFEVLAQLGLMYDSSLSPASFHDRYGDPTVSRFANPVGPNLLEIPVSTIRVLGANWPVAGGGYFRLTPLSITLWAVRHLNGEGRPAVVYLHPWEVDPGQPRVSLASWHSRCRHYLNLHLTERRLHRMLASFSFGPMADVFQDEISLLENR